MNKTAISLLAMLLLVSAPSGKAVFAADFSFTAPETIPVGTDFKIDIALTPQNESLNAFNGTVIMNDLNGAFFLEKVIGGATETKYWIQAPKIENNKIYFAGIIPGGQIKPGALFSVIVKNTKQGSAVFSFADTQAFLNDGDGTRANVISKTATVATGDAAATQNQFSAPVDSIAPEIFHPAISKSEYLFDGKPFIMFIARDSGSGINRYEIAEAQPLFWSTDIAPDKLNWKIAESPCAIEDKYLSGAIYVKAIDNAGNERISAIKLSNFIFWRLVLAVLVGFALFTPIVVSVFRKKKKHAK
ncbi:MAG: hypothetical protein MUD10_01815 [Candidatus Pacebacteria bacterium]|jgi:hypothetical protein|nr:hypothetical protein [Candidatus Paceibacterota bacterium]